MKKFLPILLAVALFTGGCGILLPKKVELFQDKVHKFPEPKAAEVEVQRQAAQRAEEKARETLGAALAGNATLDVVNPAKETVDLTDAISTFVGPPLKPASTKVSSASLSNSARSTAAKLNDRVEDFKKDNNENAGKKIEGTGLIRMNYFVMWGGIILVVMVLWAAVKAYGMFNPAVGLGANVVEKVSTNVLKRGFAEVVQGGNWFKEYLTESDLAEDVKAKVTDMFRRAHGEAQSRDVGNIVDKLTIK